MESAIIPVIVDPPVSPHYKYDIRYDRLSISPDMQSTGCTELMHTILRDDSAAVDRILKEFRNPLGNTVCINEKNNIGWTALYIAVHNAAHWGLLKYIPALITAGADVDALIDDPYNRNLTILLMIVQQADTLICLEAIQMLINAGADVNAKSKTGRTVLMYAVGCWGGHPHMGIIRALIKAGANPHAVDNDNNNALMHVVGNTRSNSGADVVQMLLDCSINVNHKNNYGKTALLLSIHSHYTVQNDIFKLLLNAGADVNACDSHNDPVLMHVAKKNTGDSARWTILIRMLLNAGANVNAKNKFNESALSLAFNVGEPIPDIIIALVEAGADLYVEDKFKQNILEGIETYLNTQKTKPSENNILRRENELLKLAPRPGEKFMELFITDMCPGGVLTRAQIPGIVDAYSHILTGHLDDMVAAGLNDNSPGPAK